VTDVQRSVGGGGERRVYSDRPTIAPRMGLMMETTTELEVTSVKKVTTAMMRKTIAQTGRASRNCSCSPMSLDRPETCNINRNLSFYPYLQL